MDEIILISAHYDHLGKDHHGKVCAGAADNASGVAAMLQAATQMSMSVSRPKRSVLFVAFDCEEMMLLGSFAFSCQREVQEAKIVAVINVDMLGRDFFDVVQHTLFLAGAERYPSMREKVREAGTQAGIRILPVGTDFIGPRGDHVAFESRGIPCLFFSCGTFKDYHQPGDTADKLNYGDIHRSAVVIVQTASELANAAIIQPAQPAGSGYSDELCSVRVVLTEVNQNRARAGVKDKDAEAFDNLAQEARDLSSKGIYDKKAREKLIVDACGILAPYFFSPELIGQSQTAAQQEESKALLQYLQQFYINHGSEVLEGYRRFVAQLLRYRPGLVRNMPKFDYEFYDIADDDISLVQVGGDQYALNVLGTSWTMIAEVKSSKLFLKSFHGYVALGLDAMECEGTREQLEDFCLLRLRGQQTNEMFSAGIKKVLHTVLRTEPSASNANLITQRIQRGGFRDETDWTANCILSGPPDLAIQAIHTPGHTQDDRVRDALCKIIANRAVRADVRAAAIEQAGAAASQHIALTLCDVLDDSTLDYQCSFLAMTRSDYPFANRAVVRAALQVYRKELSQTPSRTLGQLARSQLKKLAKRDLGASPQRWREWIRSHRLPQPIKGISTGW